MNLENYYFYFNNTVSKDFCKSVLEHGKKLFLTKGTVDEESSKGVRNSDVAFISEDWIYSELEPYLKIANENANWNFQYDYFEACQFTSYKENQYYGWHCDAYKQPYKSKDENYNNKIRKLSLTLLLNSPDEYEGGEFEIDCRNKGHKIDNILKPEMKGIGSLVIFPSFVWHRVKPVTKGTRHSLVIWVLGKPYR